MTHMCQSAGSSRALIASNKSGLMAVIIIITAATDINDSVHVTLITVVD